jgi:tellurite resistance protein TehA-like permease
MGVSDFCFPFASLFVVVNIVMLLSHCVFFGVLHEKEEDPRSSLCVSVTSASCAAVEIGFVSLPPPRRRRR